MTDKKHTDKPKSQDGNGELGNQAENQLPCSNISPKGDLFLGVRSHASTWMLRSAMRFTDQAKRIEDDHPGEWKSPHVEEHKDLVIAAVLGAATFLEAMVNELFADASDNLETSGDRSLAPLSKKAICLMSDWWRETKQGVEGTLAKYQLLLEFNCQEKLDKGAEPYQSADLLLKLRNKLIHYRPETVYVGDSNRFENRLSGRFPGNGLVASKTSNYWLNCVLGAGCSQWSHETARALADEVVNRIGITPMYQRILK